MYNSYYFIVIAIIALAAFYKEFMTYLQIKASKNPVPDIISDVYDEESYQKHMDYFRTNNKFKTCSNLFSVLFNLGFFGLGGFGYLDNLVRTWSSQPAVQCFLFFAIYIILGSIVSIPFGAYDTFVIEEKFGFNRSTVKTFIKDTFISTGLSLIIAGGLMAGCSQLYQLSPDYFWIYATVVILLFSLVMQYIYSDIIVPLFNKQEPLPDGELRNRILDFANSVGFEVDNIYVMDASKRSTKANAYFTGFGKKKRIVLFDTLIDQLSTDEIVAVLAHEIGHYKNGHIWKGFLESSIKILVTLFIFSLVITNKDIAISTGANAPSFHINMVVFSLLLNPINIVLNMVTNILSRKYEWEADEFARIHGYGNSIASGLKKMTSQSLSNLTPHPWVVLMEHSHPTLYDRVRHVS